MRGEQIRAILAQLRGASEDETVQRTDGGPDEQPAGRLDDVTTVGESELGASELSEHVEKLSSQQ